MKEKLQETLKSLIQQRDNAQSVFYQMVGQIALVESLLKEMEEEKKE